MKYEKNCTESANRRTIIRSVSRDRNQKPAITFMYLITFYLVFCFCGEGDPPIYMIGRDKITSYDKIVSVRVTQIIICEVLTISCNCS